MLLPLALAADALPLLTRATPLPTPTDPPTSHDLHRRGLLSSAESLLSSAFAAASTSLPAAGLLPGFDAFPTDPDETLSKLNLTQSDLDDVPADVLSLPGYANWTGSAWNLRLHGAVYKTAPLSNASASAAASLFVPSLDFSSLNASSQAEAKNVTLSLLSIGQPGLDLAFDLTLNGTDLGELTFPASTSRIGEFDRFVSLANFTDGRITSAPSNSSSASIIQLMSYANITSSNKTMRSGAGYQGNASAFLVPPYGLSFVSDIDDILRVTQIYEPEKGLDNSFAYAYRPWMNMPDIYANWSSSIPGAHFHYLTTTPQQVSRAYESFLNSVYPPGSFEDRPDNFTTLDQTLQIRKVNLERYAETFPGRKLVLVADTSNRDVMRDYPQLALDFPGQVSCILLRNTSATDSGDKFPYDTSGFKTLSNSTYMFFRTPDDLTNIDFANGGCRNMTFAQNVTFSYQGLSSIFSSSSSSGAARKAAGGAAWGAVLLGGVAAGLTMAAQLA